MIVSSIALHILIHFGLIKKCHAIPDIIPAVMDEFKIYQPTILLGSMFQMKKMTQIAKNLNYHGYLINFSQKQLNQYQSGVIFTDDLNQFKWNNPTNAPVLVVSKIETKEDLREVEVSIGSEVIFLDRISLKVYESYTINKVKIRRYLGQFQANVGGKATATFFPSKDYISNMENRRCDLYGLEIKGAVGWFREDPGNYSNVQFFSNNGTYDITKIANNPKYYGKFDNIFELKILESMESRLNFSSKLFLRRDMKLGSPYISSNGTAVIGEGVFQNLVDGSLDFASGPFMIKPLRLQFVDFLPTIDRAHDAIFIPTEDSSEEIDWNVFFEPFSIEAWIAVTTKCVIFTIFVTIIEWVHDFKLVRE